MGRKCPIDGEKKLYLDCLECEEKTCRRAADKRKEGEKYAVHRCEESYSNSC